MRLTQGDIAAWTATAAALEQIDPEELDFLPEFADMVHRKPMTIGQVPGAFNLDGAQLQSIALSVFHVSAACIMYMAPKLFDATVDIGKDIFKKSLEKRSALRPAAITPADAARIHKYVLTAAAERQLSAGTAKAIANAVIAHLAIADDGAVK